MKRCIDYLILALYALCLFIVSDLCYWGGLTRHVMMLLPFGVALFILVLLRTRFLVMDGDRMHFFPVKIAAFLLITAIFTIQITYAGLPYHGKLAWVIDDMRTQRRVKMTKNNVYSDGVSGIIEQMRNGAKLPEELYVGDHGFSLEFSQDGTVQRIETYLYAKDLLGRKKAYLVSYDVAKDRDLHVWVSDYYDEDYETAHRLEPIEEVLIRMNLQESVKALGEPNKDKNLGLLYYGLRDFTGTEGVVYLPGDADGDGVAGDLDAVQDYDGPIRGYAVSLYVPEDEAIPPMRFLMEPQIGYTAETEAELDEEAQAQEASLSDTTQGFASATVGYHLQVVDSACGSRFYSLEKTEDGGSTWKEINPDPFQGDAGVAEGVRFFDENYGYIGLSHGDGDWSNLWVTYDGGVTFTQIVLPMEKVEKLPQDAIDYDLTLEDFDYQFLPEGDKDSARVLVVTSQYENSGITFVSEDRGQTWQVQ